MELCLFILITNLLIIFTSDLILLYLKIVKYFIFLLFFTNVILILIKKEKFIKNIFFYKFIQKDSMILKYTKMLQITLVLRYKVFKCLKQIKKNSRGSFSNFIFQNFFSVLTLKIIFEQLNIEFYDHFLNDCFNKENLIKIKKQTIFRRFYFLL